MKVMLLSEVKNLLLKLSKEGELTREQKISLEHSEKVVQVPATKSKALVSKLEKIGKINPEKAYKIADLLPIDKEEIKAIFAKETYIPPDEEIEQILDLLKEYR